MIDRSKSGQNRRDRGYTVIELLVAAFIGTVLTVMAIPTVKSVVNSYRLQGAVAAATWAVQSTRYQALMAGYPYQVVFTQSTNSYQIQNSTTGSAPWTNVGSAVPLSGSAVTLNQDTTFKFSPNGSVSAPVGSLTNFTLSYNGTTENITVSTFGNVKVTCTPVRIC